MVLDLQIEVVGPERRRSRASAPSTASPRTTRRPLADVAVEDARASWPPVPATSPRRQDDHAAGRWPGHRPAVSAARRSRNSAVSTISATFAAVDGSSMSRRVAMFGSSQVPAHEPADRAASAGSNPHRCRDVTAMASPTLAVVAGPALADVVQQGGHGQQVGARRRPRQDFGGLHARLDAVPVDGVAVDRRRRPAQADVVPLRQPVVDHAGVVELVPHRHEARARR